MHTDTSMPMQDELTSYESTKSSVDELVALIAASHEKGPLQTVNARFMLTKAMKLMEQDRSLGKKLLIR